MGYYALTIHKGDNKIINKDGYLFITDNGTNYLLGYTGNESKLVLPDNYNGENYQIYNYAFYNRKNIASVTLGNGITAIGDSAFFVCNKLNEIIFNGTVAEWNAITKGSDWENGVPALQVVCSDGTVDL